MRCMKHSNQKQTCLFADRLFLACLSFVWCISCAQQTRHFVKICISFKKSKQVTIQNAMCFLLVCLSVGFALMCSCFACMGRSLDWLGLAWGLSNIATKNKLACLQIVCVLLDRLSFVWCIACAQQTRHFVQICISDKKSKQYVSCLFVCRLVLLLCVLALLACTDRWFLACLFVVRLMYRVCIANMPFRHFLEQCNRLEDLEK